MHLHQNYTWREVTNKDSEAVKNVIFPVLTEYGLPLDKDCTDSDLNYPADFYKAGFFGVILTKEEQEIVGTFGLLPHGEDSVEIRKMYLLPEHRGKGIGRFMLKFLLDLAKKRGYKKAILDTASSLVEAINMYEKYGFVRDDSLLEVERCDRAYYKWIL